MKNSCYISIGIPFYNAEKYLEDAICSVLVQTHKNWELILINDGSTDKSLDIANKYAETDSRIRVLSDGKNKKLPYRLNQIINEAQYDFIARMDADDLMSCDRLEKQLTLLKKNDNIDFITTGYLSINEYNKLEGVKVIDNYQVSTEDILNGEINLVHASLLARKTWYLRNLYNENSLLAEDYHLWLEASKKKDLNYLVIEEPLYWYRVTENVTLEKMMMGYNTQIDIIEKNFIDIISKDKKDKIIRKFEIKKKIIMMLDKLGMLKILLKLRYNKFQESDQEYYNNHLNTIYKSRL